jgi:hypothetical protein
MPHLLLIDLPTERTTAATDLLLAVLATGIALWLHRMGSGGDRFRVRIWTALFALLGLAAGLGAVAHGLQMPLWLNDLLWQPLNLAMGLVVALFVVAASVDGFGLPIARRLLLPLLAIGVVFYLVTCLLPGGFLLFILYEGLALLLVLGLYLRLMFVRKGPGAGWMLAGVVVTLLAAVLQASPVAVTLIWPFDHNGIFHLVQMIGVVLLACGVRTTLLAAESEKIEG